MDAEQQSTMNSFIGNIVSKRVIVKGPWVRDRSHSWDDESIGVFDDGNRGKTEIHPVDMLLIEQSAPQSLRKDFDFLVFSDDSGNFPAHVPHSDEDRLGQFQVPVRPGAILEVRDIVDMAASNDIRLTRAGGAWVLSGTVHSGRPSQGKGFFRARITARPTLEVSAVSRSANKLDIFTVGNQGNVDTAAWEPAFTDGWHGWWHVAGGRAETASPVSGVSRSTNKLDIVVTGNDGGVYTAAWEPAFKGSWHGWWRIGDLVVPPATSVSAVSRSTDKLDVFATGSDGAVRTAAWEPAFKGSWHGWWQIAGGKAAPGAPVAAVSRSNDKLDVFVVGLNGAVATAAWEPAFKGSWHGWWQVGTGIAVPQGGRISAVSRSPDKLDIFACGTDGGIYTAAWQPGDTHWRGWWRIGNLEAPPGALVSAVSRSADKLDIFVTAADRGIYTAAWEPSFKDGWHGWWRVAGGTTSPGAPVHAVSRSKDKLDVFVAGSDGVVWTAAWEPAFGSGWHGWWKIRP